MRTNRQTQLWTSQTETDAETDTDWQTQMDKIQAGKQAIKADAQGGYILSVILSHPASRWQMRSGDQLGKRASHCSSSFFCFESLIVDCFHAAFHCPIIEPPLPGPQGQSLGIHTPEIQAAEQINERTKGTPAESPQEQWQHDRGGALPHEDVEHSLRTPPSCLFSKLTTVGRDGTFLKECPVLCAAS